MFKRCLSPLTLVNQVALIVLLSTAISVAGMAVSGWLVQGVQGSAHATNKVRSLRMQSYRLLAAVSLDASDQPLLDEMEKTTFSPELIRAVKRDGQQAQLKAPQGHWHTELAPGFAHAQTLDAVAQDVMRFVGGLDKLVTAFDHTTELRIERVVPLHRLMAIFMTLLPVFIIIRLRVRLLESWKQLLAMVRAVSQRDFTRRARISGHNEMATLGSALNNMSEELTESHAVLEQRAQERTVSLEYENQILSFLWQANRRLHFQVSLYKCLFPVLSGLQNLILLHDIELRVYDLGDEDNRQEFTRQSNASCDEKGCHLCPRGTLPAIGGGTILK